MKIGFLTIGQSPRNDIMSTFKNNLKDDIKIFEAGALDMFSESDFRNLKFDENKDFYITRLRSGNSIQINKGILLPFLQKELEKLEQKVDLTVILCTGSFPELKSKKPILYPDKILVNSIKSLTNVNNAGVLIPVAEQKDNVLQKWNKLEIGIIPKSCSPYRETENFKDIIFADEIDLIVLDCMGYNEEHKSVLAKQFTKPIILSKEVVSNYLKSFT